MCRIEKMAMNNENQTPQKAPVKPQRKQRLRLPFDDRKQDFIGWIYDHRIGLITTIIIYLTLSIAFVTSKIITDGRISNDIIYIDMGEVQLLEDERDRLLEEIRNRNNQVDWSSVRNTSSNENALNEGLRDEKGTDVAALNAEAEATERERQANREAYERGLREIEAIGKGDDGTNGESERRDVKRKGTVTVSFSLSNPTRYSRHLVKPAYRCEGGGEVVVAIIVNQRGEVVSAWVESGGDACMRETAVTSARNSRFDENRSEPTKQQGTITYIFIPQ